MNTTEILATLQNKKITIFLFSEFGFPHSIHAELKRFYFQNYAQYQNMLHITYRPKRKRTDCILRIYPYTSALIFEGHIAINAEMFTSKKKTEDGMVIRTSEECFSPQYIENALNSTDQRPLLHFAGNNY